MVMRWSVAIQDGCGGSGRPDGGREDGRTLLLHYSDNGLLGGFPVMMASPLTDLDRNLFSVLKRVCWK